MRKRILTLLMVSAMTISTVGCGAGSSAGNAGQKPGEIPTEASTEISEAASETASTESSVETEGTKSSGTSETPSEASDEMLKEIAEENAPDIDISGCDTFTQIVDKKLTDGMGYANEKIGDTDVLLVSSGTYDNLDGNIAAIDAAVFAYDKDGVPFEVGKVTAGGTAYPLAVKDGILYVGSNHWGIKYTIKDGSLVIAEKAAVEYDTDGNENYFYEAADRSEGDPETKFQDFFNEIGEATVINFQPVGEVTLDADNSDQTFEGAKVSYLGPQGTYTEEAAQLFFYDTDDFLPEDTVDDAIEDVVNGDADYAVIPQENTLGGAVTNYVDALIRQEQAYVVGEVILPISQTLMGISGSSLKDIRTVCSHAQGLTQSAEWRKENLPDAETEEMESTAAAAKYVSETADKSVAAVAAPGAAKLYGLTVLAENVQITDTNKTRFYVLSTKPLNDIGKTRAVLVATCGAEQIDDIIVELHDTGLEFVSIHDRPEGSKLGMYNYIIEVAGENGITEDEIKIIEGIDNVRYLGSFDPVEK